LSLDGAPIRRKKTSESAKREFPRFLNDDDDDYDVDDDDDDDDDQFVLKSLKGLE
jgi:hypothetical protein